MSRKATQAEKIAKMDPKDVAKLTSEQLLKDVAVLRRSYKRRVGSFKRKGLVSYAQIALENSLNPNKKSVQLTKMNRHQLLFEFYRYSAFFNADTSSEKGINKVNKEQDKRIFGVDSRGRPKNKMSQSQRELFWKLYDEYKNQNPTHINRIYSSESIQQLNAEALFGDGALFDITSLPEEFDVDEVFENINVVGFINLLKDSLDRKKLLEDLKDVPNVFSGRRSDFN